MRSLTVPVRALIGAVCLVIALGLTAAAGFAVGSSSTSSHRAGPVDIGFSQDMAVHHEQAIQMAEMAPQATHSRVLALARAIERNQSLEVGTMRGWLQLWAAPQLPEGPAMSWMPAGGHPGHPDSDLGGNAMPGMASGAELQELQSLRG